MTAFPLTGPDGEPLEVSETFGDVTAELKRRRQLMRSNIRMQSGLDLARRWADGLTLLAVACCLNKTEG